MIEHTVNPFLSQHFDDRRIIAREIHDMQTAGKPWWAYGLKLENIQMYVGNTFPGQKSLYSWVKHRAVHSPPMGMEIAGDGLFLKQLTKAGLSGGICLTLKDFREEMYPGRTVEDAQQNIHLVPGSAFRKSTWEKIPSGIDFAICVPVAGEVVQAKPELYGYILSQVYEKMNFSDSFALFVLSNEGFYHSAIPQLQQQGIDIRLDGNRTSARVNIWLQKHNDSPTTIAFIP